MGTEPDKPNNGEYDNGESPILIDEHLKIRIAKDDIDKTLEIKRMSHPALGYIATLGWVGTDEISGDKIRQPAIWLDINQEQMTDYFISYEGYANYKDYQITQSHLVVPRNGDVLKLKNNIRYFFNSHDSVSPNLMYSLDSNNTSIIMNNISIYNKDYNQGLMINLRASFDGLMDDDVIGGNVNILCSIDEIS